MMSSSDETAQLTTTRLSSGLNGSGAEVDAAGGALKSSLAAAREITFSLRMGMGSSTSRYALIPLLENAALSPATITHHQ